MEILLTIALMWQYLVGMYAFHWVMSMCKVGPRYSHTFPRWRYNLILMGWFFVIPLAWMAKKAEDSIDRQMRENP